MADTDPSLTDRFKLALEDYGTAALETARIRHLNKNMNRAPMAEIRAETRKADQALQRSRLELDRLAIQIAKANAEAIAALKIDEATAEADAEVS